MGDLLKKRVLTDEELVKFAQDFTTDEIAAKYAVKLKVLREHGEEAANALEFDNMTVVDKEES